MGSRKRPGPRPYRVEGGETWLRVGAVAQLLGVSPQTARNYIDSGQIPSRRIGLGGRYREVQKRVVLRFLADAAK